MKYNKQTKEKAKKKQNATVLQEVYFLCMSVMLCFRDIASRMAELLTYWPYAGTTTRATM